jgi:hypothetical protein
MTGPAEFLNVQNGIPTGKILTPGAALYLHDGRGLPPIRMMTSFIRPTSSPTSC